SKRRGSTSEVCAVPLTLTWIFTAGPPVGLRAWSGSRGGGLVELRLQRREELRHEQATRGPDETLADGRDESSDLSFRIDGGQGPSVLLREAQPSLSLDEARAAR